jgi:hypothetical protein
MGAPKGNKNAIGNNGGRPPFFTNEEDLQEMIDSFFAESEILKEHPTISKLAYHLGFISRQSIYDYAEKVEFTYTIKRAILRIEMAYEQGLRNDRSPTGSIFALKNFGWEDKSSQDLNINGNVNIKPKQWVDNETE